MFRRVARSEWAHGSAGPRVHFASRDTVRYAVGPGNVMLADMLQAECVSLAMDARTKETALRQLAHLFTKGDVGVDEESIFRVFADREALASTGVGSGVAIPHGRLSNLPGVRLVVAVHRSGVDFDAVDGRPVHIFVGVLAPNGEASKHLKVLARVSRLLRESTVRRRLLEAETQEAARQVLIGEDARE